MRNRDRASLVPIALMAAALLLSGCRSSPPNKAETVLMTWSKRHLTIRGKSDVNPVKDEPGAVGDGKLLFTSYCMVCHGLDGQNTGVPFAELMSPPVPSLASADVQGYTDGQLKWIIKNGIWPSGMPPSNGQFGNDDMWRMVLYIRHLPPKGSLGDPAVYSSK